MKKTAKELIEIIVQNDLLEPLFNDNFDEFEIEDDEGEGIEDVRGYVKNLGLGELEYKDSREDTSEFWTVVYFKDHDIYLKIDGEYDSYGQGEHSYDSIKQVKPKEITTTIYK